MLPCRYALGRGFTTRGSIRNPWRFDTQTILEKSIVTCKHRSYSSNSVDPHEVSHFDSLASSWWDPHGPSRLLHLMNPSRHSFIASCIASQPDAFSSSTKIRYLDVGCGGGIFAESAARLHNTASVTAIDPSKEVLGVARQHARRDPVLTAPRLVYKQASLEELEVPSTAESAYDIVTLFEVLEHAANPSSMLQLLSNQVRPGGWLVLSTIARTWPSWMTTKVMAEDVLRLVPRGTHRWAKFINVDELQSWFETGDRRIHWENARAMGVVYVPGLGWKEVAGSENIGNYFFGIRKKISERE